MLRLANFSAPPLMLVRASLIGRTDVPDGFIVCGVTHNRNRATTDYAEQAT